MTFVSILPVQSRKGAFGPQMVNVPAGTSFVGFTLRLDLDASSAFVTQAAFSSCQIHVATFESPDGVNIDGGMDQVWVGGPNGTVVATKQGTIFGGGTFSTVYYPQQVGGSYNVTNPNTGASTSATFGLSLELY